MSVNGLDPGSLSLESETSSAHDGEGEKWGGTGGNEGVSLLPSNRQHVKVPTGHELREMKEASELYRSNAFKFQVRVYSPSDETTY
jgi:U3 small nucleolar RNA-associated protein 22